MFKLSVTNLAKRFGALKVFSDINFELETGGSIAIVGPNGSGKTTLMMTLLAGLRPSKGEVIYRQDDRTLIDDEVRNYTSLVSPYLNLYDNLSAEENMKFFATVSGRNITGKEIDEMLVRVGLEGRGMNLVREYSSGMKQRLKYAVAILKEPPFLFLDEPTSNLDDNGKEIVTGIINEYRDRSIIVIATNEKEEYDLAGQLCRVNQ
jgi:heme exporter protein A